MAGIRQFFKHAWNAFIDQKLEDRYKSYGSGVSYGGRIDRARLTYTNERSIITSIINRLSIDAAAVMIKHVKVDEEARYLNDVDSGLNNCLTLEGNIDQAARHLRQDAFIRLLDKGTVAVVPVDTTFDPNVTGSFDIKTLRVGEIIQWMPKDVRVRLYNEEKGIQEDIVLAKKFVAIVENPLYAIMNEPNSTLQRLIRKLNMLDAVDEQSSSGKLDLIIQLPYVVKSEARREQAEKRRKDIEFQLKGSQYGIAYTDGTEKITQLNRPVENNLLKQIEFLTEMLYGQLGLTKDIMNGTANEAAITHYYNRSIEPIVTALVEAMRRTFLTKTARSQGQTIMAFRDPFRMVALADLAEIADKFSRNEILTSNEIRQCIGIRPSKDPKADMLRNSNMPQPNDTPIDEQSVPSSFELEKGLYSQNGT